MTGYVGNIEEETLNNSNFREVIFTAPHSQLVLMSLKPGEEIGEEVHDVDQFFRIEQGEGKVVLNGEESQIKSEFAVVVPAGAKHNVINTGSADMKLYTIYSPAHHRDGTVHKTKADAMADEEDHV
jgi:mannose-6-phosphate isomerase-like protein (cupin superfamily)